MKEVKVNYGTPPRENNRWIFRFDGENFIQVKPSNNLKNNKWIDRLGKIIKEHDFVSNIWSDQKIEKKIDRPTLKKDISITPIINFMENTLNEIEDGSWHEDNDYDTYLYELVVDLLYGDDYYKWKNSLD